MMYGWAGVFSDHQFFYEDTTNRVLSFDHGHFFPSGPNWTIGSLRAAPVAIPDPMIVAACGLTNDELGEARNALLAMTAGIIAGAVSSPPVEWGLSIDEQIELATYLETRLSQLVAI
jgi:hypothetical protein